MAKLLCTHAEKGSNLSVKGLRILGVDHNASHTLQAEVARAFCRDLYPALLLRLESIAGITLRSPVLAVFGTVFVLPKQVCPPSYLIALRQQSHEARPVLTHIMAATSDGAHATTQC